MGREGGEEEEEGGAGGGGGREEGQIFKVDALAKHLEWIIREEKKRKLVPPSKPNPNVPQRKKTGILGTLTDEYAALDKKYMEDEGDFEKRASKMQRRREVAGESSIYAQMQPFDRPEIETLYQKRIDYLFVFNKGKPDKELCWCQGEVIEVNVTPKKPNRVMVR